MDIHERLKEKKFMDGLKKKLKNLAELVVSYETQTTV